MKITREIKGDKYEFELTDFEMYLASEEYEKINRRCDIEDYISNEGIQVSDDEIEEILYLYQRNLDNSEDWFYSLQSAINQVIK